MSLFPVEVSTYVLIPLHKRRSVYRSATQKSTIILIPAISSWVPKLYPTLPHLPPLQDMSLVPALYSYNRICKELAMSSGPSLLP